MFLNGVFLRLFRRWWCTLFSFSPYWSILPYLKSTKPDAFGFRLGTWQQFKCVFISIPNNKPVFNHPYHLYEVNQKKKKAYICGIWAYLFNWTFAICFLIYYLHALDVGRVSSEDSLDDGDDVLESSKPFLHLCDTSISETTKLFIEILTVRTGLHGKLANVF